MRFAAGIGLSRHEKFQASIKLLETAHAIRDGRMQTCAQRELSYIDLAADFDCALCRQLEIRRSVVGCSGQPNE